MIYLNSSISPVWIKLRGLAILNDRCAVATCLLSEATELDIYTKLLPYGEFLMVLTER